MNWDQAGNWASALASLIGVCLAGLIGYGSAMRATERQIAAARERDQEYRKIRCRRIAAALNGEITALVSRVGHEHLLEFYNAMPTQISRYRDGLAFSRLFVADQNYTVVYDHLGADLGLFDATFVGRLTGFYVHLKGFIDTVNNHGSLDFRQLSDEQIRRGAQHVAGELKFVLAEAERLTDELQRMC